jgi:outer membrane protein assembly factor BamA
MIRFVSLVVLGIQCLCAVLVAGPQSAPAGALQLAAVDVSGAKRYTQADVARLSGLATGTSVTTAHFDAATKKLAATGLFKEISYRYATVAGRTTVTFAIEEAEWTMPVVFDNFVWFNDDELVTALRQRIPSFDGTAPILDGVTDFFAQELQALLTTKSVGGSVEFVPQASLGKGVEAFLFRVTNPGPKVCALRFTGAAAIKEAELAAILPVVGSDYSRSFIVNTSRGTLTDMYRQRGHWRAAFGTPTAVVEQGQACSGVSVTIPVEEGSAYALEGITWNGNGSLPSRELDALVPLKAGAVADGAKLDEGMRRVATAYGKHGYIMQRAAYTPRLNEEKKQVAFDVKIEEGPQFRFGTLTFPGLSPDAVQTLTKRWRLKTGDVFDATYPSQFYSDEIGPRLRQGAPSPAFQTQVDEQNRVVNVRYVFGGATQ